MPSATSIERQQYYAHPRNQFWNIVDSLFAIDASLPYRKRCALLLSKGVAVWDVLAECIRKTSLDADILASSLKPNDIAGLIAETPSIRHIFFNGQKAEQIYQRHIGKTLDTQGQGITCTRLPSSSPANARLSLADKISAWQKVAETV